MKKIYSLSLTIFFVFTASLSLTAQNNFFADASKAVLSQVQNKREIFPEKYRGLTANVNQLKTFLWSLPSEKNFGSVGAAIMEIPMPDGSMAKFQVWESSVMEPALQAKFPEMRTFAGKGIDDPYASIRLDFNPYFGFHAQILSVHGRVFIDPYAKWDVDHYISYYTSDNKRYPPFTCETIDNIAGKGNQSNIVAAGPCRGAQLYTYRLALACTGEYAVAVCSPSTPTVPATAAAMLTTVNRVTGVYETEIGLRMVLIGNNNLLIYLDGATDPYTNNNGGTMLGQNQANIDAVITSAGYDIGHVVSTGGGGVANLRVPCVAGSKARGVTGLSNPVGDNFDIDYVAHEMGHQWGGNHTFNSNAGSCNGNRNGSTAYEVGSATTIQGYAGICGADDIQPHSDPFFHTISFDEISNYIETGSGNTCKVAAATGNTLPVITAMNNNGVSIPISTPFTLTGVANDPNGDPLTYCWEEWDLGPTTTWNGGAANTTAPLFKSRIPLTSGSRTFPSMAVILAGFPANPPSAMGGLKGETLPTVARDMKFRLTVRDVHPGAGGLPATGGIVTGGEGCQAGFTGTYVIHVVNTGAPFAVTVPNGGESYPANSTQTVTWNVVGTDAAPISVANVKISLSTDGGLTYPTVIAASTPNDGSELVTIPNSQTTTARIKVEAVGNVFFDISNANFIITAPTGPDFTLTAPATPATAACPAPATVSQTLGTAAVNGFVTPITFTATAGVPAGTTVTFTPPTVAPGSSTSVTLNNANTLSYGSYTITVTATAGATVHTVDLTYIVQPGAGPTFTQQPSSQSLCQSGTVTFTVAATGALTYQWQKSTDGGTNWSNIAGATGTSYTIVNVQPSDAALYRNVTTGQCNVTNSNPATLTVQTAPSITSQPTASTVCGGGTASFTVGASGAGLSYQWQVSTNACATWNNVTNTAPYSGATTATLTINPTTPAMSGWAYRVVVSGTCSPSATSNSCITLTVNTPVAVTAQPANSTVCAGSNTSFSATASGTVASYQWQLSTDGGTSWNNVNNGGVYSNATTSTLNITGATAGMTGYQYRLVVNGAAPCGSANSNGAILTVQTAPSISSSPSNNTLCVGASNTFTVTAAGSNLTYQWQVSTDGGNTFTNLANGAPYSGVSTASLTVNPLTAAMNGYQFRAVVSGSCAPSANSGAATLTVISPVAITTQPLATTAICSTGNTQFSVTGSSTVTIIYQWQVSVDGGTTWNNVTNVAPYSGATTSTLTIANVPTSFNGNKYRVLLSNATCTSPTVSNTSTLTVNVLPTASVVTSASAILAGNIAVLTATTTPTSGLNIQWQRSTDGGVTWADVPGATTTSYTVNVNNLGDYRVRVVDVATGTCVNYSTKVSVSALPSDNLFIFPSPTPNGIFTVTYYNSGGATTEGISVYDYLGRRVYNTTFAVSQAYQLTQVNMRRNSAGVYIVVLRDSNGKRLKTGKVVIR